MMNIANISDFASKSSIRQCLVAKFMNSNAG